MATVDRFTAAFGRSPGASISHVNKSVSIPITLKKICAWLVNLQFGDGGMQSFGCETLEVLFIMEVSLWSIY